MSQPYQGYEHADPIHNARGEVGGGSSTGAQGFPTGLHDTRSDYDTSKGYNSSTGASYSRASGGGPTQTRQRPLSPSPPRSDDRIVGDAPLPYTASTAQRAEMGDHAAHASHHHSGQPGERFGERVREAFASVHVSWNLSDLGK